MVNNVIILYNDNLVSKSFYTVDYYETVNDIKHCVLKTPFFATTFCNFSKTVQLSVLILF